MTNVELVAWVLVGMLAVGLVWGYLTFAIARGHSDPLVENGVAMIIVCGKGKGLMKATDIAPNSQMGAWSQERHSDCNTWYHYAPSRKD
jgi:hypothetical protein